MRSKWALVGTLVLLVGLILLGAGFAGADLGRETNGVMDCRMAYGVYNVYTGECVRSGKVIWVD